MAKSKLNVLEMLKVGGYSESELKGKSQLELMRILSSVVKTEAPIFELEAEKSIIENGALQIEKLKAFFKEPFEIYVKKVGQKKSPTAVRVIGYDISTSEIIVTHADKCVRVTGNDFIKSLDELEGAREGKKTSTKKGSKKTP